MFRVGLISIHPAPYRDPVLRLVHERGRVELHVHTMFRRDSGHPYWRAGELPYPNQWAGRGFRVWGSAYLHPGVLAALLQGRYDVVVIPGYHHATTAAAIACCIATGTPYVLGIDTMPRAAPRGDARDDVVRFFLSGAGAVWCAGGASRQYARTMEVPDERLFEGMYALDVARIDQLLEPHRARRAELRRQLGLSDETFTFLWTGQVLHWRRVDLIVRAFGEVQSGRKPAALLLLGDGPARRELEDLAARVAPRGVSFLPPTPFEEFAAYYAAADAYVCARETYSLGLAQAAIASLPVVATDAVGAAADYVIDGRSGFVVPFEEPGALGYAMGRLCGDDSLAAGMGEEGRRIASARSVLWAAEQLESAIERAGGRL